MPNDWYPTSLAALIPWHTNFNTQAVATGVARGLTAGQVTQITSDLNTVTVAVNSAVALSDYQQAVTQWREIILKGPIDSPVPVVPTLPAAISIGPGGLPAVEARTRQYAGIIKAAPGYTQAIGELYGIVAPAAAPGPTQPTLKAFVETGFDVRLTFAMSGHDQIEIQSQRAAEVVWTTITFDTSSPYVDGREPLVAGQPELRRYRAIFRDDDAPVGTWSDTVEVTAQP